MRAAVRSMSYSAKEASNEALMIAIVLLCSAVELLAASIQEATSYRGNFLSHRSVIFSCRRSYRRSRKLLVIVATFELSQCHF